MGITDFSRIKLCNCGLSPAICDLYSGDTAGLKCRDLISDLSRHYREYAGF